MKFKKNVVIIGGRKFFYWQNSDEKKETIVLLHGFPGNHMGLIDMALRLGDKYRIIIPDLPACGQSQDLIGNHNLETYRGWLGAFLENVSVGRFIIIGHSFGSRLALAFSAAYPEKVEKLILITPVLEVDGFIARLAASYYMVANMLPNYFQKLWTSSKLVKKVGNNILFKSSDMALRNKIMQRDIKELNQLNHKVTMELFNEFYTSKLLTSEDIIKAECLIIAAEKDEIATLKSVKTLTAQLRGASLKIMKSSGHLVPLEDPSATAKIVTSWLKT